MSAYTKARGGFGARERKGEEGKPKNDTDENERQDTQPTSITPIAHATKWRAGVVGRRAAADETRAAARERGAERAAKEARGRGREQKNNVYINTDQSNQIISSCQTKQNESIKYNS